MNILQMSAQAGLFIIFVVIIRSVALNSLPKKTFLVLWGVALCRLLLPVSVPSKYSVYSIAFVVARQINTNPVTAMQNGDIVPGVLEHGISPILVIWLVGFSVLFIFFAFITSKMHMELRFALPVRNNGFINEWLAENRLLRPITILQSDRLKTPVTTGLIRPRIIVPKSINMCDKQFLRHVLTHEYCHIKRLDAFWKLLLTFALCIHWFNPLVWVMFMLATHDLELTCDESVLRHLGADIKTAYAYSLIEMAEHRSKIAPIYVWFSRNAVEERITAIMKFQKASGLTAMIAVILVSLMTVGFAASASSEQANTYLSPEATRIPSIDVMDESPKILTISQDEIGSYIFKGRTQARIVSDEWKERYGGLTGNIERTLEYKEEQKHKLSINVDTTAGSLDISILDINGGVLYERTGIIASERFDAVFIAKTAHINVTADNHRGGFSVKWSE